MKTINRILSLLIFFLVFSFTGCKDIIEELTKNKPYTFHETITVLPEGTDGSAGTDATYVYFGDWPQTIKADDVTIDEEKSIIMGGNIYYSGSDGNYYVRCLENASSNELYYSNQTPVLTKESNSYKYFKVEPIKWRVIDTNFDHDLIPGTPGKKLLFAETILTGNINFYDYELKKRLNEVQKQKYNQLQKLKATGLLDGLSSKLLDEIINGGSIYPNNYKYSKVRAFLNGLSYEIRPDDSHVQSLNNMYAGKGFLQTAFTEKAQNYIEVTTVDNSKDSASPQYYLNINTAYTVHDYSCENTYDKVFLLSFKEQSNKIHNLYIPKEERDSEPTSSRIYKVTDYAKANYVWYKYNYGKYFLRSPAYKPYWYEDYCYQVIVSDEREKIYSCLQETSHGCIYTGDRVGADSYNKIGIVPAIVVDF